MMPYTYPSDYRPILPEARRDAFWDLPVIEVCDNHELRVADDGTAGIYNTDDEHGWVGEHEQILDEWADILYAHDHRYDR